MTSLPADLHSTFAASLRPASKVLPWVPMADWQYAMNVMTFMWNDSSADPAASSGTFAPSAKSI